MGTPYRCIELARESQRRPVPTSTKVGDARYGLEVSNSLLKTAVKPRTAYPEMHEAVPLEKMIPYVLLSNI